MKKTKLLTTSLFIVTLATIFTACNSGGGSGSAASEGTPPSGNPTLTPAPTPTVAPTNTPTVDPTPTNTPTTQPTIAPPPPDISPTPPPITNVITQYDYYTQNYKNESDSNGYGASQVFDIDYTKVYKCLDTFKCNNGYTHHEWMPGNDNLVWELESGVVYTPPA